jgi:hypothetical protein
LTELPSEWTLSAENPPMTCSSDSQSEEVPLPIPSKFYSKWPWNFALSILESNLEFYEIVFLGRKTKKEARWLQKNWILIHQYLFVGWMMVM